MGARRGPPHHARPRRHRRRPGSDHPTHPGGPRRRHRRPARRSQHLGHPVHLRTGRPADLHGQRPWPGGVDARPGAPAHPGRPRSRDPSRRRNPGERRSLAVRRRRLGAVTSVTPVAGGPPVATIAYDPLGRPSVLTQGLEVRQLRYCGSALVQEDVAGHPIRQPTPNPWGGAPLAVHLAGETFAGVHDVTGSQVALVRSDGAVVETCRHEPFGWPQILDAGGAPVPASTVGVEPTFAGLRWLPSAGLYLSGLTGSTTPPPVPGCSPIRSVWPTAPTRTRTPADDPPPMSIPRRWPLVMRSDIMVWCVVAGKPHRAWASTIPRALRTISLGFRAERWRWGLAARGGSGGARGGGPFRRHRHRRRVGELSKGHTPPAPSTS